jgi:superfamily II DNA or RNA helicase
VIRPDFRPARAAGDQKVPSPDHPSAQNLPPVADAGVPFQQLRPGDRVRVRGAQWRLVQARSYARCAVIGLAGIDPCNRGAATQLLTPFDRPTRLGGWTRPRIVSAAEADRTIAALHAAAGPLRVAPFARMDILPHQLDPALALLAGDAARVLIADEVGLGKTVQAGLAVAELRARGRAARVLALTPAGLREQWSAELSGRFGIEAALVDAAALRRRTSEIPRSVNPWSTWATVVASLDFAKRPDVLGPLADVRWDILIVDEAHAAGTGSDRHAALARLAARALYVLLLTATPHNGDDRAFAALCDLGRGGPRDDVLVFRRTRAEAGLARDRRVRLLRVGLTVRERRMHRELTRYIHRVVQEARRRHDGDAVLAMIVLAKRALSGAAALARSLERRLILLSRRPDAAGVQMALPLIDPDEEVDHTDEVPDAVLGSAGFDAAAEEALTLTALLDLARDAAASDSKLRAVRTFLRRAREPAIVFTEYRDTLVALVSAFAADRPLVLHGGIEATERAHVARAFASGESRLLLATDVAAEGLNLQRRCRLVVSLELPWTPSRLEQRIGRVDRIGQTRRVHALNLIAEGTAESRVLARLIRRLVSVRRALPEVASPLGAPSEEAILIASLDAREPDGAPGPELPAGLHTSTSAAARDAAARMLRWRASVSVWGRERGDRALKDEPLSRIDSTAPWLVFRRTSGGWPPGLIAIFRTRIPLTSGATEDWLTPLHLPLTIPHEPARVRRLLRIVFPALQDHAEHDARERAARLAADVRDADTRIRARRLAIDAAMTARAMPVQAGLFQQIRHAPDTRPRSIDDSVEHRHPGSPAVLPPPELLIVFCVPRP